ncbi:RTA1-like protein [Clavulina sp. PMI_390]|nr:RTA1-like protein [Clavulina sp. PMI_390]
MLSSDSPLSDIALGLVRRHSIADPNNLLGYVPNPAVTAIVTALYASVSLIMIALLFQGRSRARYMLTIIIVYAAGVALRFVLKHNGSSVGLYAISNSFVVLSPCAFIAANYMMLARLARQIKQAHYLLVGANVLTRVFVCSDVTTFLIQAAGGGISTGKSQKSVNLGSNLFIIGLGLQLASYLFFTAIFLLFLYRVRTRAPDVWSNSRDTDDQMGNWRTLALAITISSAGIIIRSIYRVIEGSQGYFGPLATNQIVVYTLDSLPLFIAIAIYILIWPGNYIDSQRIREDAEAMELK